MSDWPINQPDDPTRLDVPTDILCSFHYFGDIDMGAMRSWGTRIIGDSGAFSAMSTGKPIEREVFHAWADRWRDDLLWVAALDVIGDAEASYQNWLAARRDGLELVPTIHYGEGTAQLDRFAEEGATLIGLGGMVPYSSEKERLMRWTLMMHRHARDHHPQVRFHGWGISHPYLVDNLPWWSTDSSGFSSCFRFGTLRLWEPRRGRFVGVDLNGRDLARHARLLREVYGIDWRVVAESKSENRRELGRVAIRSVQLYAAWLQKRQAVTPPALLIERLERESSGPLSSAAVIRRTEPISAMSPDGSWHAPKLDGPLQVAAMVTSAQGQAITPDGLAITGRIGNQTIAPLQVAAMGAPAMQPSKAVSPDGGQPPLLGPLQSAAWGEATGSNGPAIHPEGRLISRVHEAAPSGGGSSRPAPVGGSGISAHGAESGDRTSSVGPLQVGAVGSGKDSALLSPSGGWPVE